MVLVVLASEASGPAAAGPCMALMMRPLSQQACGTVQIGMAMVPGGPTSVHAVTAMSNGITHWRGEGRHGWGTSGLWHR